MRYGMNWQYAIIFGKINTYMRVLLFSLVCSTICTISIGQVTPPPPPTPHVIEEDSTQSEKKKFDPRRLVFGGNLGASFGDYTFINVSPQVGYMFSNMFTAGAGINYINSSYKYKDINGNELYKESYGYAGLNLFGRLYPTNFLFAMVQPEINYSWGKIDYNSSAMEDSKLDEKWVPTLLVGAGIVVGGRGGRGGLMLSIQYDLAQDPRSPYGNNAFVGMGFSF